MISAVFLAVVVALSAIYQSQMHLRISDGSSHGEQNFEKKLTDVIARMTLAEKLSLIGGTDAPGTTIGGAVMGTRAIVRLKIPPLSMADGPVGVRGAKGTAFPSALNMAATFDKDLIREVGKALGDETLASGNNMLLGPCVNIARTALGGRNFESFGEDPYLAAELTRTYIDGLQSRGVAGSLKHWALNEQEVERETIDVIATPRTMHEMHFPAFKAGVEGGVLSVMSSFNRVNGDYASENDYLLNQTLKKRWGFKGFVVSDWSSVHSTAKAANAGLDLEMPAADFFAPEKFSRALNEGTILPATLDDKVRRILRAAYSVAPAGSQKEKSVDHRELARALARKSFVLLKNTGGILPLRDGIHSIALLGPNGQDIETGGGGSSRVIPSRTSQPLDALKRRFNGVEIEAAMGSSHPADREPLAPLITSQVSRQNGVTATYYAGTEMRGAPLVSRTESSIEITPQKVQELKLPNEFSAKWIGYFQAPESGRYLFTTESHEGNRLWIENELMIDDWKAHRRIPNRVEVRLVANRWYKVRLDYFNTNPAEAYLKIGMSRPHLDRRRQAVELARTADVAIVVVGQDESLESEGVDRKSLKLPVGQAELIDSVANVNPNTVVVLNGGGAFELEPWLEKVKAVIHVFYPGQEAGAALTDVLSGDSNFSGKLPISMPRSFKESSAFGRYPGTKGRVRYDEGIFVGYRWHDAHSKTPLFPFGHGLSYSEFRYTDLKITSFGSSAARKIAVSFQVRNVSHRAGDETPQLYVGAVNPRLPRPPRELKGFMKIQLDPGQSKTVAFELTPSSFAYFDEAIDDWRTDPGIYQIEIGTSSRDLRLRSTVEL